MEWKSTHASKIFHAQGIGVDDVGTDNFDSTTENYKASEDCFVQYYKLIQEHQL